MSWGFLFWGILLSLCLSGPSFGDLPTSYDGGRNKLCAQIFKNLNPQNEEELIKALKEPVEYVDQAPSFSAVTDAMSRIYARSVNRTTLDPKVKLHLVAENAVLKAMNDYLVMYKDFVTKLGDLQKEIFIEELFREENVNVIRFLNMAQSDFKTLRFAFSEENEEMHSEIRSALKRMSKRFAKAINEGEVVIDTSVKRGIVKYAELWFLAGMGDTVDEAGYAARSMRSSKNADDVWVPHYRDVSKGADLLTEEIETGRELIQERFEKTIPDLLQTVPGAPDKKVLNRFLLKIFTKTSPGKVQDPNLNEANYKIARQNELIKYISKVRKILAMAYHVNEDQFEDDDILLIKEYVDNLDHMAPGIIVDSRTEILFSEAEFFIASMDFAGLNVWNFEQTQFALARTPAGDGRKALLEIRKGERIATSMLNGLNATVDLIYVNIFGLIMPFTGDDGAIYPDEITQLQMKQVVQSLGATYKLNQEMDSATRKMPEAFRPTFVNKEIGNVDAELFEKKIRELLIGKVSIQQLEKIVFGINFNEVMDRRLVEIYVGGDVNEFIYNAIYEVAPKALRKSKLKEARDSMIDIIQVDPDEDLTSQVPAA